MTKVNYYILCREKTQNISNQRDACGSGLCPSELSIVGALRGHYKAESPHLLIRSDLTQLTRVCCHSALAFGDPYFEDIKLVSVVSYS